MKNGKRLNHLTSIVFHLTKSLATGYWLLATIYWLLFYCSFASGDCLKVTPEISKRIEKVVGAKIYINGTHLKTSEPLWRLRGTMYLPLDPTLTAALNLDMAVTKEESGRVLRIMADKTEIKYSEGACAFTVNGVITQSPAVALFDMTYRAVPLRTFFEALGGQVLWNSKEARIDVTILKDVEREKVVRLPDGFFKSPLKDAKIEKAEDKTASVADETRRGAETPPAEEKKAVQETATETEESPKSAEELEPAQNPRKFQYTYENTIGVDSSEVEGDETASYVQEETVFHNLFSLRAKDILDGGYEMNGFVRTIETTDDDTKKFEFDKLTVSFNKGSVNYDVYDLVPKFSRFLLRDYRLQGVQYERAGSGGGFDMIMGKTPKRVRDSEYARYVGGARYAWGGGSNVYRISYVQARDTGTERGASERVKNRVVSFSWATSLLKAWNLEGEYAVGGAWGWGIGGGERGSARFLKAEYKAKKTRMTLLYEGVGANFVSETAFYTPDRTEFSATYQKKPNTGLMYMFGYKSRLYRGNRTYFYPASVTIQPLSDRSRLKVMLDRDFQKTAGEQSNIVDNRKARAMMKFGDLNVETQILRRKDKNKTGNVLFRTARNMKLRYPLSEKLGATVQFNREQRQQSTTPLLRQFRANLEYELKEWTDMILSMERYYNATAADNTKAKIGFRKVNVYDDWEIGLDFQFVNYRDHNDRVIKVRYSFLR
ncbi:MAG: hypothetical protein AB1546_05075 [bacterium]